MKPSMPNVAKPARRAASAAGRALAVLAVLAVSGCGPIMSALFCSDQKQTDMDCSLENPRPR